MANLLSVENLTKSYGDRMLFADICFGVDEGDKIGVVARNGTGKTTLLRIIAGDETPDSGTVVRRNGLTVGYLPQEPVFEPDATVHSAAMQYATAETDDPDAILRLLSSLGLTDPSQPVAKLSGGQRKKLAIARTVVADPALLILDEPTNHLDISTIEWLENYLKRSRKALLMVTHDRYFLDRVCNTIMELDRTNAFMVAGNYATYLRRRAERIEAMTAELAKVRNTLRREQEWMSRQPQARAGKAKFRIDNFYELKSRASVNLRENNVRLETASSRIGSKIFEAEGVNKAFGDKIILRDFTYTFARGEKIGIVGTNGVGKSTFIKMLQGLEPFDSGRWDVGETVRFGYYSQDGIAFDQSKKVIDAVTEIAEDIQLSDKDIHIAPMQYLQRFLFTPADQQKYIHTLSGGERCRLHLAVVLMRQPNFLILDEPTNDLDIVTLGVLEEYLASFKGCVIVVSHDRYFLDNIADHLFVMEGNGVVKDFPGNYSEYRAFADEQARASAPKAAPAERPRRSERPEKMTFKERREFEALEAEIASLEEEKSAIEAFFASAASPDPEEFATKSRRYQEIKDLLDEKELRWLELSEKA